MCKDLLYSCVASYAYLNTKATFTDKANGQLGEAGSIKIPKSEHRYIVNTSVFSDHFIIQLDIKNKVSHTHYFWLAQKGKYFYFCIIYSGVHSCSGSDQNLKHVVLHCCTSTRAQSQGFLMELLCASQATVVNHLSPA